MRNKNGQINQSGVGNSPWFAMSPEAKDWTFMLENPSGATVTVEASLVDVRADGDPSTDQTWAITDLTSITTGGLFGALPKVRAIRVNVEVGAGAVVGHVLQ